MRTDGTGVTGVRARGRRGPGRAIAIVVAGLGLAALLPGVAQAGVGAGAVPTFPTSATVGNAGLPASVELRNNNSAPNEGETNTVCNFGDGGPCPVGDPGITLIPSCGQLGAFSTCTPAGADPGVIRVSDTATGAAGTACAGMGFNVTLIEATLGQVRFTPQGGAHVTLPGSGSVCRIDFTFQVLASPRVDQSPTAGVQTVQVVDNTQFAGC